MTNQLIEMMIEDRLCRLRKRVNETAEERRKN